MGGAQGGADRVPWEEHRAAQTESHGRSKVHSGPLMRRGTLSNTDGMGPVTTTHVAGATHNLTWWGSLGMRRMRPHDAGLLEC
eukprot:135438-Chlamydomonas_euryale.AAC.1